MTKLVSELTFKDLADHPVWDFFEDTRGNVVVKAVARIPVRSLQGRLVGCEVTLNNGERRWAHLSNIDLKNDAATRQFLSLCIFQGKDRFTLARYFDVDYPDRGPIALSKFLSLNVRDVFPISYDIGNYVTDAEIPTAGKITEKPYLKLSADELIRLTLE